MESPVDTVKKGTGATDFSVAPVRLSYGEIDSEGLDRGESYLVVRERTIERCVSRPQFDVTGALGRDIVVLISGLGDSENVATDGQLDAYFWLISRKLYNGCYAASCPNFRVEHELIKDDRLHQDAPFKSYKV